MKLAYKQSHISHLHTCLAVLARAQEESAVYERVPVEHQHGHVAEYARHSGDVLAGQRGQDEATSVVVPMVTLILHLQQKDGFVEKTYYLSGRIMEILIDFAAGVLGSNSVR